MHQLVNKSSDTVNSVKNMDSKEDFGTYNPDTLEDNPSEVQGGSNMTGTDLCVRLYKSVPVIFEPPCIITTQRQQFYRHKYSRTNRSAR